MNCSTHKISHSRNILLVLGLTVTISISHWNLFTTNRTSILHLRPMPQAVTVKHMLLRARKHIDPLIHSYIHIANRTVSPRIHYISRSSLFSNHVNEQRPVLIFQTATTKNEYPETNQRRQSNEQTHDHQRQISNSHNKDINR